MVPERKETHCKFIKFRHERPNCNLGLWICFRIARDTIVLTFSIPDESGVFRA